MVTSSLDELKLTAQKAHSQTIDNTVGKMTSKYFSRVCARSRASNLAKLAMVLRLPTIVRVCNARRCNSNLSNMVRNLRTFTPKKAAEEIGCSSDTIRRYCALYKRHLSDSATPTPGRPRMLTAVDIYILKTAKAQTEAGLTIEEIDDILSTVAIPEEVVDEQKAGEVATMPAPASDEGVGYALLRQMATALDKLEAKEARLAKVEADLEEKATLLARLQDDVANLKTRIDTQSAAPALRPLPWAVYGPYITGIAVVAGVILAVALVVALFP